ncbi:DUF1028 domain-containing protein [Acuticoccus mangrovi]|uniref:DUF1028 domain-containing protein n=1 Tax=Acuticoccus mangrovi TaxID=2796142 RepID=A0A934IL13_9HYPH|nr:DUF1028 domain-containing protein [Acuticoccus mangrovi]MBJ3775757.1 DUF1028 domain-containing protein [Acuticoccus mangrovi]
MTFSISARCPETGMFGIAISSSSPAVAARCSHTRAGVGVIASQNVTDPMLGINGLDHLAAGMSAADVIDTLVASTPYAAFRQLTVVDNTGATAGYSGSGALGIHAIAKGTGAISAGNLLADEGVPAAIVAAFEAASSVPFPGRLLAALEAGLAAGGEAGPVHSAGLKVVRDLEWPLVDLRIDWSDAPIADLATTWEVFAPQMEDYVNRAIAPGEAPSFGVPGDPA